MSNQALSKYKVNKLNTLSGGSHKNETRLRKETNGSGTDVFCNLLFLQNISYQTDHLSHMSSTAFV